MRGTNEWALHVGKAEEGRNLAFRIKGERGGSFVASRLKCSSENKRGIGLVPVLVGQK